MKALITGIHGFVGPHLKKELEDSGYEVFGTSRIGDEKAVFSCDITDKQQISEIIKNIRPDCIFHLAGFSSVAKSFEDPESCFTVNVEGTRNLLDAVVKAGIKPRILIVSSAEVYGKPEYIPIDEKHPLNPLSPYGKSRVEQEKLVRKYDLPIIISRSFNHTGPGQSSAFVIPSFKKQIQEAKDGDAILTGNLDIIRDFSDIKDVVRAYRILIEKGIPGEAYNVGSGIGYKIKDILEKLIKESKKKLKIEIDPNRFRKADIPELVADCRKLKGLRAALDFKYPF